MSSSSRTDSFPSPRESSSVMSTDLGPSAVKAPPSRSRWGRSRAVAPAMPDFFDDHATDADGYSTGAVSESDAGVDADARDTIFISKPPSDFLDLRSLLFGGRQQSAPSADTSPDGPDASATACVQRKRKPTRRRLRAKEELCLTLPRSGSRPKRSWFLGPGLIGREGGEHILVATKDPSMDPVHAEISVDGDDYLMCDHHSSGGTFLCLSTIHRHYPQRDGFRLRRGDSFFVGLTTKVTVEEIVTEPAPPDEAQSRRRVTSGAICGPAETRADGAEAGTTTAALGSRDKSVVERHRSSRKGSSLETLVERDGEAEIGGVEDTDAATDTAGFSEQPSPPTQPSPPRRSVHFADAPPRASDGSVVRGTRYQRTRSKPKPPAYPRHRPVLLTLSVRDTSVETTSDSEPRRVRLGPAGNSAGESSSRASASTSTSMAAASKDAFLLGTSSACDVQLSAEDVHPVHARIVFDGFFFLLQDLSFDWNPQRKTRVALTSPTRLARGDTLLLGKCELHVTTPGKAFRGRDRDMKEVAVRCRLLRVSKRKARAPSKFVPVGFRGQMQEGFVFGKGRDCAGQVFTSALAVEQFSVQLDHGACMMTPKAAGINQGTYFLLGRDAMPHATERTPDLVQYSSKALMLVEGCVFKCGNTELEVVYIKSSGDKGGVRGGGAVRVGGGGGDGDGDGDGDGGGARAVSPRSAQTPEELLENAELLGNLPWLQQIAFDARMIENIARRGKRLTMEPGDAIYDEGDAATFLFIVIEGEVELSTGIGSFSARRGTCEGETGDAQQGADADGGADAGDDTQQAKSSGGGSILTEFVSHGCFFGEICLNEPGMEYAESARASGETGCVLLVFDREDLAGYLGMYMDIIRPHLALETQREMLHCLRLHVPWLSALSYSDMRLLLTRAERLQFESGELLVDGGRLLASLPLVTPQQSQEREGLLLLVQGKALLTRPREKQARPKPKARRKLSPRYSFKSAVSSFAEVIDTDGDFATDSLELPHACKDDDEVDELDALNSARSAGDPSHADASATESNDGDAGEPNGDDRDGDEESQSQEEWWRHAEPLTLLPSTAGVTSSPVVSLEARSRVECFFLDAVHVAHLAAAPSDQATPTDATPSTQFDVAEDQETRVKPLLLRKPTNRRSSFAAMHHRLQSSQIITKELNAASMDDDDDDRVSTDAEDDVGHSPKWRRRKRNTNVLEKTLLETQENAELPNALVIYVLSGANRGDVHVVRNVAAIGAFKSGVDIELNDRYVSASHAVIEHHDGRYWLYDDFSEWGTFVRLEENKPVEIHPGDVFLAGEVEFTCLGAFPDRKKTMSCCLQ